MQNEGKISPKRKFWAGYPSGHPAKNFGQALHIMEKQALGHGHPARTSTKKLRSEKLRADFSFLRKVVERKFPEFFDISSRILPRILLRIFPEFFEDFSCLVPWEMETIKNSPKMPAIFQCKIPRQTRKNIFTKFFWRAGKVTFSVPCFQGRPCTWAKLGLFGFWGLFFPQFYSNFWPTIELI